jgi:hypothetical protein
MAGWFEAKKKAIAEALGENYGVMDRSRSEGQKLLSSAYRAFLGRLIPEADRLSLKLPEGATWADAIAVQTIKRAVGLVSKENICFTAIAELRETTEGKNAERIVTAGNEELAALARVLAGPPAEEDGAQKLPSSTEDEGSG